MAKTKQAEQAETDRTVDETTQTEVKQAEFAEATETTSGPGQENLDLLLDINMPLTVNMGKTIMPFRKLLQLGPGAVIQLDKIVGEPADLYIQDIKFATGDIVVVGDCFAVRIKEILGTQEDEPVASA